MKRAEVITIEEITDEWLKQQGFKITNVRERERRLDMGRMCSESSNGGLNRSSDDLCLALQPNRHPDRSHEWFVWLVQRDPNRSIFIRYCEYTYEIVDLIKALTGEPYEEK